MDKILRIKTSGRDDSHANTYNYPYEPTPYEVLERVARSGYIGKKNTLIDYGCGKGRVSFYFANQCKCHTVGIEYDERLYEKAVANEESFVTKNRTAFLLMKAQDYKVGLEADRFFFFNPFSETVLRSVMHNIVDSYYENPRQMYFFFYYPSDEYISYLMTVPELEFFDEIDCADLFDENNRRERVIIFLAN